MMNQQFENTSRHFRRHFDIYAVGLLLLPVLAGLIFIPVVFWNL